MPANLPPDYYAAEERFRSAKSGSDKIACLEEMLMIMPKHKGTDKLRADLRRRISKIKTESQTKKTAARRDTAFHVEKEGGGQVAIVGCANTGKSHLVRSLTNANPEVADYPQTTRRPLPGMMPFKDIYIQLVDTPPLDAAFIEPGLWDCIRSADLVCIVLDCATDPMGQLESSVTILEKHRIVARHLRGAYDSYRFLYSIPFLVAVNKCDDESMDENIDIFRELLQQRYSMIAVSAMSRRNLTSFAGTVYEMLEIIRVYSKPRGKEPDLTDPFILARRCTIETFAVKVHKDFAEKLKAARIWGVGVYDGQMVNKDHVLRDGDIVELHI